MTNHVSAVKAFFLPLAMLLAVSATLSSLRAAPPSVAVIREPGAIYLEGVVPKAVKVMVLENASIYYQIDMARYLGTLTKGQVVEIQAIADHAFRVRGYAMQGQVVGWIDPKSLAPLKPEFLDSVKKNAQRREEVQALIERNEVALNMTPDEVSQSLGKPSKKTARVTADAREDVWEFIRYERVPQQVTGYDRQGRLVTETVLVKVPAGKLAVIFKDSLVSELEQSEGVLEKDARIKIVTAPFTIAF